MDQIKSYNGLWRLNEHGDLSFLFYFSEQTLVGNIYVKSLRKILDNFLSEDSPQGRNKKGNTIRLDFRRLQRSFQASLPLDSQTCEKCQAN